MNLKGQMLDVFEIDNRRIEKLYRFEMGAPEAADEVTSFGSLRSSPNIGPSP
jgi:hypothetical protein